MNNEIEKINITFPGQILDHVDTKDHLLELFNYITNLQEELKSANESISWWQNRFNAVEKQNNRLKGENQDIKDTLQDKLDYIGHLKELCDKYEEEHNTEFKIWKDERCQLLDYKSRCKKAIKHIKEYCIDDEFYINLTNKEKNIIDVLNILQDGE